MAQSEGFNSIFDSKWLMKVFGWSRRFKNSQKRPTIITTAEKKKPFHFYRSNSKCRWKRWGINYLASSRFTFWKKHTRIHSLTHNEWTVRNQFEIKTRWRRFEFLALLLHIRIYCVLPGRHKSQFISDCFRIKTDQFLFILVDCSNFFEYHCGRKNTNSFWLMCESISRPPC